MHVYVRNTLFKECKQIQSAACLTRLRFFFAATAGSGSAASSSASSAASAGRRFAAFPPPPFFPPPAARASPLQSRARCDPPAARRRAPPPSSVCGRLDAITWQAVARPRHSCSQSFASTAPRAGSPSPWLTALNVCASRVSSLSRRPRG